MCEQTATLFESASLCKTGFRTHRLRARRAFATGSTTPVASQHAQFARHAACRAAQIAPVLPLFGHDTRATDTRANGVRRLSKKHTTVPPFTPPPPTHVSPLTHESQAIVWDNSCEAYTNVKIVSYQSAMVTTALPIADGRKPGQDTVALAAQAFNVPQASEDIPGWISGHVVVPPEGIKDAEGVGMCSQVFFVGTCQPKSFELAIGAPDEDAFNEETAQRFLLSEGDFFHVPPNNIYRIQNHSSQFQAKLFWTIIRPMANED